MLLTLIILQSYIAAGMCYTLWIANYCEKSYKTSLEQHVLKSIEPIDTEFAKYVQSAPSWVWLITVSVVTVLFWPMAIYSQLHKIEDDNE